MEILNRNYHKDEFIKAVIRGLSHESRIPDEKRFDCIGEQLIRAATSPIELTNAFRVLGIWYTEAIRNIEQGKSPEESLQQAIKRIEGKK